MTRSAPQVRDDEMHSWAKAGFTWVVNDGEHQVYEGRYGTEQNQAMLRVGITPVRPTPALSCTGGVRIPGCRVAPRTEIRVISRTDATGYIIGTANAPRGHLGAWRRLPEGRACHHAVRPRLFGQQAHCIGGRHCGEAIQRGACSPYGTTIEEAEIYYKAVTFPTEGHATSVSAASPCRCYSRDRSLHSCRRAEVARCPPQPRPGRLPHPRRRT